MDERLRNLFSNNLRYYLSRAEKSQADLARYMGVSSATVSDWCNGNKMPRTDKLQSICNWLGIEMSDLLSEARPHDPVQKSAQDNGYYLNEETAKAAQEIFENPDMRILFEAARGSRPEDLQTAADILRRFKETNPDG